MKLAINQLQPDPRAGRNGGRRHPLLHSEETVKNACDALPTLFEVVRGFGGDEVIEYPRDLE